MARTPVTSFYFERQMSPKADILRFKWEKRKWADLYQITTVGSAVKKYGVIVSMREFRREPGLCQATLHIRR